MNKCGAARRAWLRRQAAHLVAQLPEDNDEAVYILEEARRFVCEFLGDARPIATVTRIEPLAGSRHGLTVLAEKPDTVP